MVSDSGRSSACTNFGMLFRFCRFSPFAEEGFTCLDHSMMSKKKNRKIFGTGLESRNKQESNPKKYTACQNN